MVSASRLGLGLLTYRLEEQAGNLVWDKLGHALWLSATEAPSSSVAVDVVGAEVGVLS